MNFISKGFLKIIRKAFLTISKDDSSTQLRNWKMFSNKEYSNQLIHDYLVSDSPCMIARFGSTEMLNLMNFIGVNKKEYKNVNSYIKGKTPPWWWEKSTLEQLSNWSGFFPSDIPNVEKFCKLMIADIHELDILGSWLNNERFFKNELHGVKQIVLEDMEPFFATTPWTRALEGKKVLVVHPFADTIEKQYQNRDLIFTNRLLPKFELITIKAVQSIAGVPTDFSDWFEALEYMKSQIDAVDYDVCIIGAGAYGFPLAAHVKRSGKKAIHLAGVTQLLFGIIGKRWEDYIVWPYTNMFNKYWVRPGNNEKPEGVSKVEGACYW